MRGTSTAVWALLALTLAEGLRESSPTGDNCEADFADLNSEEEEVSLPTTVDEEKKRDPSAVKPFEEPKVSMKYEEVGCLDLAELDEGNGGPEAEERDPFCRDFTSKPGSEGVKCRTGLPFFRKALQRDGGQEFGACMEYCLTAGLDLFGLVEPSTSGVVMETVECRCGASKHNLQVWRGLNDKDYLIPELAGYPKMTEDTECPVRMGKYDEDWMKKHGNDGTPISLMHQTRIDERYVDEILHARTPVDMIDGSGATGGFIEVHSNGTALSERGQLGVRGRRKKRNLPLYMRDCAVMRCASGEAWGNKIYYAFTSDIDSFRKVAFTTAIEKVAGHVSCIQFVLLTCKNSKGQDRPDGQCEERDLEISSSRNQAPIEGVILVGIRDPECCHTAGMGYPGSRGMRFINLGWCNSNRHIGSMIHEIGHALGMDHEHQRADGTAEYMGEGPYLEIFEDVIKEDARTNALAQNPGISQYELHRAIQDALSQYQPAETTYMGSAARGGRTKFDYASIMMYPAGDKMRSNRRRSSQSSLPGCRGKTDCLDRRMGQRNDLSEEDVLQLRDMYGCLVTERCPTIYGAGQVDSDGDCACPGGTLCYQNGERGCPYAGQSEKRSNQYFTHGCEDCRCVSPSCPAGAKYSVPDRDGDCKCPSSTICRLGSSYCPSSRGNNDQKFFRDTCKDCECRAKCSRKSNAIADFADEDGDCKCGKGTVCYMGIGTKPGCAQGDREDSYWYFDATCSNCVCKKEPIVPTCLRSGAEVTSEKPDSMGDCQCKVDTLCKKGRDRPCIYSGGKSHSFFSAECLDCACAKPSGYKERERARQPVYLMHPSCAEAAVPLKCGATQALVGPRKWDLEHLGLPVDQCGRCVEAWQRTGGPCQVATDGSKINMRKYKLVDSGSSVDLCCETSTYRCTDGMLLEHPCQGRDCGENAKCKEVLEDGEKVAECICNKGFEEADDDEYFECIPIVPSDSRCCGYDGRTMWVPPKHLDTATFLGCVATGKKICPTLGGKKWRHLQDWECEGRRFVYGGDGETPPF